MQQEVEKVGGGGQRWLRFIRRGKDSASTYLFAFLLVGVLPALAGADGRIEAPFNDGWEFCRRDGRWERVQLPHDCAIREGFDASLDSITGDLPWKRVVRYRRVWNLPEKKSDRRYALAFGGVMGRSTVFVNGEPVGGGEYGYLGFQVDATPYLRTGSNLVTVVADTTRMRSRWYPGAGIYRSVRRIETGLVRLVDDSLAAETENVLTSKARSRLSRSQMAIRVRTSRSTRRPRIRFTTEGDS